MCSPWPGFAHSSPDSSVTAVTCLMGKIRWIGKRPKWVYLKWDDRPGALASHYYLPLLKTIRTTVVPWMAPSSTLQSSDLKKRRLIWPMYTSSNPHVPRRCGDLRRLVIQVFCHFFRTEDPRRGRAKDKATRRRRWCPPAELHNRRDTTAVFKPTPSFLSFPTRAIFFEKVKTHFCIRQIRFFGVVGKVVRLTWTIPSCYVEGLFRARHKADVFKFGYSPKMAGEHQVHCEVHGERVWAQPWCSFTKLSSSS